MSKNKHGEIPEEKSSGKSSKKGVNIIPKSGFDEGFSYPVAAELTTMYFGTRTYDSGTFPAGRYRAVRFSIGEAKGKNWWCVMYPPLCVSAATDKATLSDVMNKDACTIVSEAPRYAVRFKVVEWFETIMEWIR